MKRQLLTILMYTAATTLTGAFGTIAGVAALAGDRKGRVWWPATRMWARGLLTSAGVTDFIVRGAEIIDNDTPYVMMANHQSHLDPPSIIRASKRPFGFIVKKELERIPLFGWAVRQSGHVFVDRKDKGSSHASIDKAAASVARGRRIVVFPEGTRTTTGELLPFKKGGFVLALKAEVPIIPIGVAGTREILPSQSALVAKRGPVAVVFGEPIATDGYDLEDKDGLIEAVRAAILGLRAEAEALVAERAG